MYTKLYEIKLRMSSVKNKKMIFLKIEGYFRNDFKGRRGTKSCAPTIAFSCFLNLKVERMSRTHDRCGSSSFPSRRRHALLRR